jgi:ribonucleoside-diphosphate reductase beta chain
MSYAYRNRGLKTISGLQESTALEENVHYSFGMDLINIIKRQYPQMWDEYFVELVTDNIEVAYQSELNLIDWFFENGVPEHLTKEEVVNFLNYNFNVVCKDLQLDLSYPVDEVLFAEKSEWFKIKVFMTTEPDFFDSQVSGYASDDELIDIDNFNF